MVQLRTDDEKFKYYREASTRENSYFKDVFLNLRKQRVENSLIRERIQKSKIKNEIRKKINFDIDQNQPTNRFRNIFPEFNFKEKSLQNQQEEIETLETTLKNTKRDYEEKIQKLEIDYQNQIRTLTDTKNNEIAELKKNLDIDNKKDNFFENKVKELHQEIMILK
mmetsp:Transcript_32026/g.28390  ORF Transcript_32026/g.28390 Transcript_32026/m.28390 type:complete len:166 (-) Transcript_32026:404-901(-)